MRTPDVRWMVWVFVLGTIAWCIGSARADDVPAGGNVMCPVMTGEPAKGEVYARSEAPRWSLLVGSQERPVALAFRVFERYQRVLEAGVSLLDAGAGLGAFVKQVVLVGEERLPIVAIASLLEVLSAPVDDARGREKA